LFPPAESTFVHQIGQFLLHELLNLFHGFIESLAGGAGNMEVKGGVLSHASCQSRVGQVYLNNWRLTDGVAMDLSG
jgi:hypothetical protein